MRTEDIKKIDPFFVGRQEKREFLTDELRILTEQHQLKCLNYQKIINAIGKESIDKLEDIPFIPVRLFKDYDLKSIKDEDVVKTMTSSGTSGQRVSKIFLDKETSDIQRKVLVRIVSGFTGESRLPMLVIDSPSVIRDRKMFSARGAGILGFSIFGKDITYALKEDMSLNIEVVQNFLDKHHNKKILLFGFTYMIWQHFYRALIEADKKLVIPKGILIHGGGWKKLIQESVSKESFKEELFQVCGIKHIHDYYGMVEQTGSIYMECEEGHLHASTFSDVIMRRKEDFSPCEIGEEGIVQVVSILAKSYPGHSLLTEDTGIILGEDNCKCGKKGKYFVITGRIKNAEIRGCSDTYGVQ